MFKKFLVKQLVKRQLKNLPPAQQDMIVDLISENPDLFKNIGEEIKEKTKGGMNEQYAIAEVMKKYQSELQKVMPKPIQKFEQQ